MPARVQERFKDLGLNVVVYEKNPERSRVFIDLGEYREGDVVGATGLRVVRIVPDGVVLDYGEGRFLLRLYQ
jgi:hypothetical protein